MGTWTNTVAPKRRKHKQQVSVPVVIDVENLEDLREAIERAPDSYAGEVTNVSESSGIADVLVTYTARGANVTDVKTRLNKEGVQYATKRPKTERLCGCEGGGPCTED